MRKSAPVLAWLGAAVALLLIRVWWFGDPLFWDENCYVGQARLIAQHGFDWAAYRTQTFMRPPVLTALLALVVRAAPSVTALRAVSFVLCLPLLPLTFGLARRLGGSPRACYYAAGMCAIAPIYVAQIGLVESDVLTAVLATLAWVLLLDRRMVGFMLVSILAVWTKESAYALSLPAAFLIYRRKQSIFAIWPAAVPGLALLGWLGCHKLLVGVAIPSINAGTLSASYLWESLNHSLVEGGRYALTALGVWALWRSQPPQLRDEQRATAVFIVALALMFPGPLPRYMLPSLAASCALAALALDEVPARLRFTAPGLIAIILLAGWFGRSWHTDNGSHMDYNLSYRSLLLAQREAARTVAAAHPKKVLAVFPMYFALALGPDDHYLPSPIPTDVPRDDQPLSELCQYDFIVDADQGNPLSAPLKTLRDAGALTRHAAFGIPGYEVRILKIACK
jgi:hypothetical protein